MDYDSFTDCVHNRVYVAPNGSIFIDSTSIFFIIIKVAPRTNVSKSSYTVFTHLLNSDGQKVAQQDNPPVNGTYPTTLWLPDEIVADPYAITLPTDLGHGEYPLQVGFFVAANGLRLADPVVLDTVVTIRP